MKLEGKMLSKKAVRRLTKLAEFMEAFKVSKRQKFDMTTLGYDEGCGTTACALGWAATIPNFRRLGLKELEPLGKHYTDVASEFFDINIDEAWTLFSATRNVEINTPKQWAAHCRKFLRDNA